MSGLPRSTRAVHRFSILFTAQNVRDLLSTEDGILTAVDRCKRTGVTKVYLETFRDGYQANASLLQHVSERFRSEGLDVSGCVTTTGVGRPSVSVGKPSAGWRKLISCYTDQETQMRVQSLFEHAAGLFNEIMIDDFWFTDCTCPECDAARVSQTVTIGERTHSVADDSWASYRCELMVNLARERVLAPAKRVNQDVRFIIKYPLWYDGFREAGYEVIRETRDFDRIWVGTETRDYSDPSWGGIPQYHGYFIMRWLGGLGGDKCGGGWYDSLGTTEHTYLEQARQTVLGGARESFLFSYGSLLEGTGPRNIETLRENMPELLTVSEKVQQHRIVGVAAYKPPNSNLREERHVFDFVGMMGVPLAPCHEFPWDASAAFFSLHALAGRDFANNLLTFIGLGKPVLLTDGLAKELTGQTELDMPNISVLKVRNDPRVLLEMPRKELNEIREPLLAPLKVTFRAPNRVALYLFSDGSWVIENFNDAMAEVRLNRVPLKVPARGWSYKFLSE